MACENSSPLHKNNNNSNNNETIQLVSPLFCATLFLWEPWRQRKTDCKKRAYRTCRAYRRKYIPVVPGVVKAAQQIELGFKTAGQIKQLCVDEGDYIREGQLIARLDDTDYQLQLAATESQYRQLSTEMTRLEELHRRNNITDNDYEKAVAGLEQLKAQLESNRNTVNYTQLHSPISGYIRLFILKKQKWSIREQPLLHWSM